MVNKYHPMLRVTVADAVNFINSPYPEQKHSVWFIVLFLNNVNVEKMYPLEICFFRTREMLNDSALQLFA